MVSRSNANDSSISGCGNATDKDSIIPVYSDNIKYKTPTCSRMAGVLVSRRLIEENRDKPEAIALAVLIKGRHKNGCIYDYNPHKVALLSDIDDKTAKVYIEYLISIGIAIIRNGNLCIKKLRCEDECENKYIKQRFYAKDLKALADELLAYIIEVKLRNQQWTIDHKKRIFEIQENPKSVNDIRKMNEYHKANGEIVAKNIDEKVRMTTKDIRASLGCGNTKATRIKNLLRSKGYDFRVERKLYCNKAKYFDKKDLPKYSYVSKGRIITVNSYVVF